MKDNIEDKIIRDKVREWEANTSVSSADTNQLWNRLEYRLPEIPEKKIKPVYYWWAAAAVLLFGIIGSWPALQHPGQQPLTAAITAPQTVPQNKTQQSNDTITTTITNIHKPEHSRHQRKMVAAKRSSRNAAPSVSVAVTADPDTIAAGYENNTAPGMLSVPAIKAVCYDNMTIQKPLCY